MNIEDLLSNIDSSIIKPSSQVINEAKLKIESIQKGVERPIKVRYSHFNDNLLGGIYSQTIVTIGALSGGGKTTILKHIETDMFNKTLNPNCDNYVLLKCNYEMTSVNLVMRQLKDNIKKPMRDIYNGNLSPQEKETFEKTFHEESNPNIFYIEEPLAPKKWWVNVRSFLEQHQDKERVVVTLDHLGLIREERYGGLKQAMDDLLNYQNELKKEFSNVSFINLSQLNRDLEGRTGDPKNHAPRLSDFFNSSNIAFISDVAIIINNAYRLGIDKYMVFPTSRYPHLKDYMLDPDRDKGSFETKGNVFWHYVKIRQNDFDPESGVDNSLWVERLYPKPKSEFTLSHKLEQMNRANDIPRMDNTVDLWDDIPSKYDENDDMPF